jgi:hypothetical protein
MEICVPLGAPNENAKQPQPKLKRFQNILEPYSEHQKIPSKKPPQPKLRRLLNFLVPQSLRKTPSKKTASIFIETASFEFKLKG